METAIKISDMVREYTMGETKITAVDHISFEIPKGAYTIILGTTFPNIYKPIEIR